MPVFIPGLKLSELFYHEAVKPIVETDFPGLNYSAALIGYGSDVLGYDTEMSIDHNWGPRLLLFLAEADYPLFHSPLDQSLREKLPVQFYGYSTHFSRPDLNDGGTQHMEYIETGPVNHLVQILIIKDYFESYVGIDPYKELQLLDWLTLPEQKLLVVTGGKVYYDGLNELNNIRQKLSYYPHEIWLYLLSAQWDKIAQEEAFVGRCGEAGDELGSAIVASRIVRNLMKLCFLMEKQYAPYPKWFGTAYSRLKCAPELSPLFQKVLQANNWKEREQHLSAAYEIIAQMHNALSITKPLETHVSSYFNRPFQVIHANHFAEEIQKAITDPAIKDLKSSIGAIDQFIDSTPILSNPSNSPKLKALFL